MSGPLFIVLDTETTGVDPAKDQVIELGFAVTDLDETICSGAYLAKATVPITPEASAVHHLLDCDLAEAEPLADTLARIRPMPKWEAAEAYVAHNAPFDKPFLPMLDDKPWIDTLRAAKRYLPDVPSHSNQALRYRLKLDVPRDIGAHRAEGDCIATAALLRYLLVGPAKEDFERLGVAGFAAHVDSPLVLTTVTFGRHAGRKWTDVPCDYLRWLLRTGGFDPDVMHTAKAMLNAAPIDPERF